MTGVCPSCGYNLEADRELTIGDWRIDPRGGAWYRDRRVVTRHTWTLILLTLAREAGREMTSEAMVNRISESGSPATLRSQLCQLRASLRDQGVPDPIGSRRGSAGGGYWWKGD